MAINKNKFSAVIDIIGINPFVFVPTDILENIFEEAKKNKGAIPIKGIINSKPFKQTLVRYSGEWRLYINTFMLKNSPKRIGEKIELEILFDSESREIVPPEKFVQALEKDKIAKQIFDSLSPSLKKEIVRYLAHLKTEESLNRNITRAIRFLKGEERFVGRDKP